MDTILAISKDVVICETEGKKIIVPLVNGIGDLNNEICTLSETGWSIWQNINGINTLGQVAEVIAEQFSSPVNEICKDVLGLSMEMIKYGICLRVNCEQVKQQTEEIEEMRTDRINKDSLIAVRPKMVQLPAEKPSCYIKLGGDLQLSTPAQFELLSSMEARGIPLRTMVRGFSMYPFIRDRDFLTISPYYNCQPRIGEVVAFCHPENEGLVIHRIIKKTYSGWLVKGDNCLEIDGIIKTDKIIGRVTVVERNDRRVRFGLGVERIIIAFMNRGKGLAFVKKLWLLLPRIAGFCLRQLQNFKLYRTLFRHFSVPLLIYEASENDMEEIHKLIKSSAPYHRQLPNPNVTNFVARSKNKLVGFAQLVYHPKEHDPWVGFWLFSLYVKGTHRGLGIGEKLTRKRIEKADELGAKRILLMVNENNNPAIELNKKLGFTQTNVPNLEAYLKERIEKTGQRYLVMKKELGDSYDQRL